mmetsp:Transcript_15761/g.40316  ORF Transcript_15761/g.40316 Transcript_15761/m.40316 type:complete len:248 (+) Transcript_15761:2199-2942(+)
MTAEISAVAISATCLAEATARCAHRATTICIGLVVVQQPVATGLCEATATASVTADGVAVVTLFAGINATVAAGGAVDVVIRHRDGWQGQCAADLVAHTEGERLSTAQHLPCATRAGYCHHRREPVETARIRSASTTRDPTDHDRAVCTTTSISLGGHHRSDQRNANPHTAAAAVRTIAANIAEFTGCTASSTDRTAAVHIGLVVVLNAVAASLTHTSAAATVSVDGVAVITLFARIQRSIPAKVAT